MENAPHLTVEWRDLGQEPKCAPNPAFPEGIDVQAPAGTTRTCFTALPYPAKRCGIYVVHCSRCGMSVGTTTAGRPDDPRSIEVPCHYQHLFGGEGP